VILAVAKWACRKLRCGALERDRPPGLPGCYLRQMLRSLKPMPENAKTAPVQPPSKALELRRVYQSISNVQTTSILDRWPEAYCEIRPHKFAALFDCISASWKLDFLFSLRLRVINFDPQHRKAFF
jgi:hypothetical protein